MPVKLLNKTQKRADKINNLKSLNVSEEDFKKFIIGIQNMSFIYNHYDKNCTLKLENVQKFIGKICLFNNKEPFIPIHVFKNTEDHYVMGGFFYENKKVVEYELTFSDLNNIIITDYNLFDFFKL